MPGILLQLFTTIIKLMLLAVFETHLPVTFPMRAKPAREILSVKYLYADCGHQQHVAALLYAVWHHAMTKISTMVTLCLTQA
jgi:hypothetical protein